MKIIIVQNEIGNFNFLNPKEQSLSFTMRLVDDEGKRIEQDGIKAELHFSGEPDRERIFEDPIENLGEVFDKCFEYSKRVWSSTDYKSQCLLFGKLVKENYSKIDSLMTNEYKEKIQKQINELQSKLNTTSILYDLSDDLKWAIDKEISSLEKRKQEKLNLLSQVKEETDSYNNLKAEIDNIDVKINDYKKYL